jgi:hypothetical protein
MVLTVHSAQFIPSSPPNIFNSVLKDYITPSWGPSAPLDRKVTAVQLVGAIARTSPQKLGPSVGEILPGLFTAIAKDDGELKESCLQVCFIGPFFALVDKVFSDYGSAGAPLSTRSRFWSQPNHQFCARLHQVRSCMSLPPTLYLK